MPGTRPGMTILGPWRIPDADSSACKFPVEAGAATKSGEQPPTAEAPLFLLRLQHQPLDTAPFDEVGLEDLVEILGRPVGVPNAFRVDHHGGAELAAIEAAGGVDPRG